MFIIYNKLKWKIIINKVYHIWYCNLREIKSTPKWIVTLSNCELGLYATSFFLLGEMIRLHTDRLVVNYIVPSFISYFIFNLSTYFCKIGATYIHRKMYGFRGSQFILYAHTTTFITDIYECSQIIIKK